MSPDGVAASLADRAAEGPEDRAALAQRLLLEFADRTGLARDDVPPRRYLWTDAFAVCTLLELGRRTGAEELRRLALHLVDQVHGTLGRHRADDARRGWLSGLPEEEGAEHPTRGGLRIGKALPERGAGEPFDERLEWERDGQYFHYLTRWMHALARAASVTGERRCLTWAIELAETAHRAFVYGPPGARRMHWKMSVDLARPLVPSMGHHDPLDGWLTFQELRAGARHAAGDVDAPALDEAIDDLRSICDGRSWTTDDPLGLGGLLGDAWRLGQLVAAGDVPDTGLAADLVAAAVTGLAAALSSGQLEGPAWRRLAFRELGLAIGLHAVPRLAALASSHAFRALSAAHLESLQRMTPLADHLERFWLAPEHRATEAWQAHLDINSVTLATSLVPDGYLAV